MPSQNMGYLGAEKVFNLHNIKEHYDALGSFLHTPTMKQIQEGRVPDRGKLSNRCKDIIQILEEVLDSPVHNVTLGNFIEAKCLRCQNKIKHRINPQLNKPTNIKCIACGAEYDTTDREDGKVELRPKTQKYKCPSEECDASITLWNDEIKEGTHWTCQKCSQKYIIRLAIVKQGTK